MLFKSTHKLMYNDVLCMMGPVSWDGRFYYTFQKEHDIYYPFLNNQEKSYPAGLL